MKRIVCVALVAMATSAVFVVAANAADTQNFSFANQGSGDSSTCGPDWANDTFTRVFKVVPNKASDGSYRVTENFTKGHFKTYQGVSPESCEVGSGNTVSANVKGAFHGFEVIKVSGGTFDATSAAACSAAAAPPACTTAEFIDSAFPGNTGYGVSDYWFKYTTVNAAACENTWINAATGNAGDIATFCN